VVSATAATTATATSAPTAVPGATTATAPAAAAGPTATTATANSSSRPRHHHWRCRRWSSPAGRPVCQPQGGVNPQSSRQDGGSGAPREWLTPLVLFLFFCFCILILMMLARTTHPASSSASTGDSLVSRSGPQQASSTTTTGGRQLHRQDLQPRPRPRRSEPELRWLRLHPEWRQPLQPWQAKRLLQRL
jgi:hypothetical protein